MPRRAIPNRPSAARDSIDLPEYVGPFPGRDAAWQTDSQAPAGAASIARDTESPNSFRALCGIHQHPKGTGGMWELKSTSLSHRPRLGFRFPLWLRRNECFQGRAGVGQSTGRKRVDDMDNHVAIDKDLAR